MRQISILMIAFGLIGLLVSCTMDTSVASSSGGRVINLPLAAQQQNGMIFSSVIFLAGIILYSLNKKGQVGAIGADQNDRAEKGIDDAAEKIEEESKKYATKLMSLASDIMPKSIADFVRVGVAFLVSVPVLVIFQFVVAMFSGKLLNITLFNIVFVWMVIAIAIQHRARKKSSDANAIKDER